MFGREIGDARRELISQYGREIVDMVHGCAQAGRIIRQVAVYCGSNFGAAEGFSEAARALGRALAEHDIALVYGGTHKGLMGLLADSVLASGGTAHGIITCRLADRGHLHPALSSHEIVDSMSIRKSRMLDRADACIAMPGGLGTIEELMEAWTLNQLGDVDKPVGLLNVRGYFDPLLQFVDHMIEERFLPAAHRQGVAVTGDPSRMIELLRAAPQITVPKWM